MKHYLSRRRLPNSLNGKYRYEYKVECTVCNERRWTKAYPSKPNRCKACAGRESYVPSKVEAKNLRKRGHGYITKQGYHLIYDGSKYTPAHRLAFPNLSSNIVVHHIDGDKLNNTLENLIPLSKKSHREAHGSLERQAYKLIQSGLIQYDGDSNSYNLSSSMKKLVELISVKTVKPLTGDAEGDTVSSLQETVGRCNDYPIEEYIRSLMEAQNT
jgi:hypothetical protein